MSHHTHWHGTPSGCPACGYGSISATGSQRLGGQEPRWPFYPRYFPAYQAGPTGPMHDKDILQLVAQYLRSDPRLAPEAEIAVGVTDGVVTLTGTVPDRWTKYYAGDDCFNVPAAVDVVNKLKIAQGGKQPQPRRPRK